MEQRGHAARPDGSNDLGGPAQTFDDVFRVIETVGKMVGRTKEAAVLAARIRRDVASVEERSGRERVRVYYELDATPYTVGPGSFVGVLLAKAGGDNVIPPGSAISRRSARRWS